MNYLTPDKLSPSELVAAVLGKKAVDDECHRIASLVLDEGWAHAQMAEEHSAATIKRIARIDSAIELGKRTMAARAVQRTTIVSKPEHVVELMEPIYSGFEVEKFYCLCLNARNCLTRIVEVSVGSLSASIVHPRELFKEAVRVSAASVILTHNHPSGDITPSGADIKLTKRLVNAGDVIGIEILDHVILGGGGRFNSMRDAGIMPVPTII